jgi:hypothetical protein
MIKVPHYPISSLNLTDEEMEELLKDELRDFQPVTITKQMDKQPKSLLEELNPSKEELDKKTKLLFPYLQYGLKAKLSLIGILNLDFEYPNEHAGKIGQITNFNFEKGGIDYLCLTVEPNYSFDLEHLNELDILLYPIESILQHREDLGFIPIVELAKLAILRPYNEEVIITPDDVDTESKETISSIQIERDDERIKKIECYVESPHWNEDKPKREFIFSFNINHGFSLTDLCNSTSDNDVLEFPLNQELLFDKIHEWHIDHKNLIGRKLAEDIRQYKHLL